MRRRRPEKRQILPDPLFNSLSIAKFINYILHNGKKGVSEKIFYEAMNIIKSKTKKMVPISLILQLKMPPHF